jgi:hypothetical protein
MTRQRSFKRLVRARMEKTGESYTAARAQLLAGVEPKRWLATSDAAIRERTGRGWEEWFDALDEWGAAERSHREIARWLAEVQGIDPLAWNAQAIAMSYERTRGMREVGEHPEGFTVTASKTVAVGVERLFDGFRAATNGLLRERTATRPRSARFDWADGDSRANVVFVAKDGAKSTVSVSHERLGDGEERERMKAWWGSRLAELKSDLEAR